MAQEYARALAKVVVAQTAETLGFDSVQQSASDALAELLLQYISELGSLTHGYAEMAGRTDCNINDVLMAFQNMGIDVKEVMEYAESIEEVPFIHSVPAFPVAKRAPAFQSFAQKGEEPPQHIPAFLPAFPETHTYKDTPAFKSHTKDPREQKLAQEKARRDAVKAIVGLANRSQPPVSASVAAARSGEKERLRPGAETNPFLLPPELEQPQSELDSKSAVAVSDVERPPVPWREATTEISKALLQEAPLRLDWTVPMGPTVHRTLAEMGFDDAFANATEEVIEKGSRKRRLSQKAKAAGDPALQRAEQILAAGSNAMNLEEAAEKEKGR